MKRMFKKLLAVMLVVLTCSSAFIGSASAANYTSAYWNYTTPGSSDYAYWNGSRTVRASCTTTSKVKWMQAALNWCKDNRGLSINKLDVDGSFGPASKTATQAFQRKYNLSVDGSFGPGTISRMKEVLNGTYGTSSKMLSINWTLINGTGRQTVSGPCGCYSLAYCRDILDGYSHSWTEYSAEGYVSSWGRYGYTASWSKAGYTSCSSSNNQTVLRALYDNINSGKPVVLGLKYGTSGRHYVAVVGYENVTNPNSLSLSNFRIIDPNYASLGSIGSQYSLTGQYVVKR